MLFWQKHTSCFRVLGITENLCRSNRSDVFFGHLLRRVPFLFARKEGDVVTRKKAIAIVLIISIVFGFLNGCGLEAANSHVSSERASSITSATPETSSFDTHFSSEAFTAAEIQTTEITTEEPATEPPPETEPTPEMTEDSTFEIFFLDVGQGDAACILCDGHAMMIDGGNNSESSFIYSFLKSHGISYLDCIVATHPDADHIGGLSGALNYADVGAAYCTVTSYDTETFRDLTKYLGRRNRDITVPEPGDTVYLGCAKVTFLYPDAGVTRSDNTSIALRIEYGDTSFFFAGDCENDDETAILSSDYVLQSTVLKVSHHGSRYSTGNAFLNAVSPTYAIISVGGDNTYGHPTDDVLSRLHDKGVVLYRTDIQGDVHCTSDGMYVYFDVERNSDFDTFLAAGGYKNYQEELAAQTEPDTSQETVPDRTIPGADDPVETEPQVTYIANTNSHKFHYPSCSSVGQMKENNKWYFTGSRDELIELGYEPCKRCNP